MCICTCAQCVCMTCVSMCARGEERTTLCNWFPPSTQVTDWTHCQVCWEMLLPAELSCWPWKYIPRKIPNNKLYTSTAQTISKGEERELQKFVLKRLKGTPKPCVYWTQLQREKKKRENSESKHFCCRLMLSPDSFGTILWSNKLKSLNQTQSS